MGILADFRNDLASGDTVARLRGGLIGNGARFDAGCGPQSLLYADYVASGRALRQVEEFVTENVLPWYANSHTEASHCGGTMTRLREEARSAIAGLVGAGRRRLSLCRIFLSSPSGDAPRPLRPPMSPCPVPARSR